MDHYCYTEFNVPGSTHYEMQLENCISHICNIWHNQLLFLTRAYVMHKQVSFPNRFFVMSAISVYLNCTLEIMLNICIIINWH